MPPRAPPHKAASSSTAGSTTWAAANTLINARHGDDIAAAADKFCAGAMTDFLYAAADAFPNARFVVTGYFRLVSEKTYSKEIFNTLRDLRVPLLKDVFAAFPDKRMNIEIKRARVSPAPALCSLIREHGMADKVLNGAGAANLGDGCVSSENSRSYSPRVRAWQLR
jgi:hypothetical protein